MRGRGHSKVSPSMHQAASMSSCPYFFLFRPISLHISHFPHFHLTTSHRHHVPKRTMQWLVVYTRTLASVLVYATGHFMVCLFVFIYFWAISLPTYLLSAAFSFLPLLLRLSLLPVRRMTLAPAMEGLLSVADLTNTNLHVIPSITVPYLHGRGTPDFLISNIIIPVQCRYR
jgi:hypothetical protein